MTVEIDKESGFCFAVTTAMRKAEEELSKGTPLYSLGDIVHNGEECERLRRLGLIAINHDEFLHLHNARVLLRAHGEPPETYQIAKRNDIEIIDATCPVVLSIQKRIKKEYEQRLHDGHTPQIIIFGQKGHAEVLGLVGQTKGMAVVIEDAKDLNRIDFSRDVYLYSQTTKSLSEFRHIVDNIRNRMKPGTEFKSSDTICRQVANRLDNICRFAKAHDLIFFVCGNKSSNGQVLFNACKSVNPNTHHIEDASQINISLLNGDIHTIGICGATSTPAWLMEVCRDHILQATQK